MFTTVYSSTAAASFKAIDLAELVMVCRLNNSKTGVTGMLVFEQGQFIQALEGPEDAVLNLMRVIRRDPRHERVQILAEGDVEERRFPDLAMGYARIDDDEASALAGYRDVLTAIRPDPEGETPRAKSLLDWLRRTRD